MSLLSTVEQIIKSHKAEQAKMNERIQLYREILQASTVQSKTGSEEPDCADNAATETNTSPGEKEDIDLLEKALEKALRVRTGSGISEKDPNRKKHPGVQKEPAATSVPSKDALQSFAPPKRRQTTIRSTSKSASLDQKWHKSSLVSRHSASSNPEHSKTTNNRNKIKNHLVSSAGVVHHQTATRLPQAGSASATLDQISTLRSNNTTVRSTFLSGSDLGKVTLVSRPSSNETVACSHTNKSGAHSLLQHSGTPSEQTAKWKSLMAKQNRLWDKIIALQSNPVPGRSHFMERMRAMFPKDWPCGSPDQIRVLVNKLTHQGHDLTQQFQTKELLAKHNPEVTTELDTKENKSDSKLTPEILQMTAAEIQNFADQLKQEWEAWDRWRPDGGCLCPTGANGVCGSITSLPLTINYTTEAELQELENLKMRVTLLQQEIYLEQALLDSLSPQLLSIVPGPECPRPSVLRDMYSLLGEGGECFPAIVLDSEPD